METKAIRLGSLLNRSSLSEYSAETGNGVDIEAVFVQDVKSHIAVHIDAWVTP